LDNTAISVANAATFAVTPGVGAANIGNTSAGTAGATLTLPTGAVFSMVDGSLGRANLKQQASFAGTALILSGGLLNFDIGSSGTDLLAVTGTGSVSGTNKINLAGSSLTSGGGPYNLITAASGLAGTYLFAGNSASTMTVSSGTNTYPLTLNSSATAVTVSVGSPTAITSALTFTGKNNGNGTANTSWDTNFITNNWANGSSAINYSDGNAVIFQDANAVAGGNVASGTVIIQVQAAGVSPSSTTFTNTTALAYTVSNASGSIGIAGPGSLTKSGNGTLTLSSPNTFTGATNINAGNLTITNTGALAATSGIHLVSGAQFEVNVAGANISKLNPANGGSGVVTGGTLTLDQKPTTDSPGTIYGTLLWNSNNFDWNTTFTPDFGQGALLKSTGSRMSWQGNMTFSGDTTIDSGPSQFNGNNNVFSASTPGLKTLTLTGTQKVVLSAINDGFGKMRVVWNNSNTSANGNQFNNASTFTGGTTILNGVVYNANATGAGPANAASITFGPAAGQTTTTEFYIGADTTLIGLNTDPTNPGTPVVAPNNSARTLTINNAVANTYAGILTNTGAAGTGTLSLTKGAVGMLTLSGSNTYTGVTSINGGALLLGPGGSLGATPVSVSGNGTFGTALIASNLTVKGGSTLNMVSSSTLNLQDSGCNTLAFTGSGNIAGATLKFDLGSILGQNDEITLTGASTLSGTVNFAFDALGGSLPSSLQNGIYTLVNSIDSLTFAGGYSLINTTPTVSGHTLVLSSDSNNVLLTVSGGGASGLATWTATAGNTLWSGSNNWTDGDGIHGVPGVDPLRIGKDTATFTNSGAQTLIDLTGENPNLKSLSFSTSSYTLSHGSLTLQSTTGTATVTVSSGTQTIEGSLTLTLASTGAKTTDIVIDGSSELKILANIGEMNSPQMLLKDGTGSLVLSGTNNYSGGTFVNAGILAVTSSSALPDNGSLTVGAGGTLIFDPSFSGSPIVASAVSAMSSPVSPVPEPSTLVLLMAGLVAGFGAWRKGKGLGIGD